MCAPHRKQWSCPPLIDAHPNAVLYDKYPHAVLYDKYDEISPRFSRFPRQRAVARGANLIFVTVTRKYEQNVKFTFLHGKTKTADLK